MGKPVNSVLVTASVRVKEYIVLSLRVSAIGHRIRGALRYPRNTAIHLSKDHVLNRAPTRVLLRGNHERVLRREDSGAAGDTRPGATIAM